MRDTQASLLGIILTKTTVKRGRTGGPIAGAHARVESAGEISSRLSGTRLVLFGPLALLARKKQDLRELYLTVEGDGFEFVVELKPKQGGAARHVAARINTMAQQAIAATPAGLVPPPPAVTVAAWAADPFGRHQMRYHDGAGWTEHVSDDGVGSLDPAIPTPPAPPPPPPPPPAAPSCLPLPPS